MAKTSTIVQIGKHKIDLTNLKKVLFPDAHIVKAELVEYYLKAAPTILRHIKGRPLSFVRFPDGVDGESFFQKNRPDWAPDWIDHVKLGEDDKVDYILATEQATMVWLANLACVEVHQMHCRSPHYDKPDYVVFDIDPPEGFPFEQVVQIAYDLRDLIEGYGYHTFAKTTGGKGVHIVAPLEPKWSFSEVHDAAEDIAKKFVESHPKIATLHVKKESRKGKVFIDIHRNRTYQTIVSPYSVRGRGNAPVSMPLTWLELRAVTDPAVFNVHTAVDHIIREGDAWETIGAYATGLHTDPKSTGKQKPDPRIVGKAEQSSEAPASLDEYARKRKFTHTPEPGPEIAAGIGNAFVVHRHHASRLHYDVRLERDGTLKCWAVPRGLPPRPGIHRLAVQTEDHPLKYLDFEGSIPKGQYGGGDMWIYARGKYEVTKEKKDSLYFRLNSREITAEYRLIPTKDKDWLLDRVDEPQVDWVREPIEPMLAQNADEPFDSPDYLYEIKWDGVRAMISLNEGEITIRSRTLRDITKSFPEMNIPEQAFRATCALYDAEIVCLDAQGRPVFEDVIKRVQQTSESGIARAKARHPVVCYLFDCLYLDGRAIVNDPLARRREWLVDSIKQNPVYRVSEVMDEGVALYEAAAKIGLEGIVAKKRNSTYQPGRRSHSWLKIKTQRTAECVIIGYTRGKGDREATFGALHLGRYRNNELVYVGKVGTGLDERGMEAMFERVSKLERIDRPVADKPLDDAVSVWVEPQLVAEIAYASLTKNQYLRAPVFVRLRPDLTPEDLMREDDLGAQS